MSPAIQLLLIQLMQLGALLASNPRFIVFIDLSGHVSRIAVRIYSADSVWREGEPVPTLIAEANVRWEPYDWEQDTPERHAAALAEIQHQLEFLRAALHAYLPVANTTITDLPEAA